MSYDLAVWEGTRPASDDEAHDTMMALKHELADGILPTQPTPAINDYTERLLARWPDRTDESLTDAERAAVPWSQGPLMTHARGSFLFFGIEYDRCDDALPFASATATELGLVCYDPQLRQLH